MRQCRPVNVRQVEMLQPAVCTATNVLQALEIAPARREVFAERVVSHRGLG